MQSSQKNLEELLLTCLTSTRLMKFGHMYMILFMANSKPKYFDTRSYENMIALLWILGVQYCYIYFIYIPFHISTNPKQSVCIGKTDSMILHANMTICFVLSVLTTTSSKVQRFNERQVNTITAYWGR